MGKKVVIQKTYSENWEGNKAVESMWKWKGEEIKRQPVFTEKRKSGNGGERGRRRKTWSENNERRIKSHPAKPIIHAFHGLKLHSLLLPLFLHSLSYSCYFYTCLVDRLSGSHTCAEEWETERGKFREIKTPTLTLLNKDRDKNRYGTYRMELWEKQRKWAGKWERLEPTDSGNWSVNVLDCYV